MLTWVWWEMCSPPSHPLWMPRRIPVGWGTDQLLLMGLRGIGIFFVSLGKMRSSPLPPN